MNTNSPCKKVALLIGAVILMISVLAIPQVDAQQYPPDPPEPLDVQKPIGIEDPYICDVGFVGSIEGGVAPYTLSYVLSPVAGGADIDLGSIVVAEEGNYQTAASFIEPLAGINADHNVSITLQDSTPQTIEKPDFFVVTLRDPCPVVPNVVAAPADPPTPTSEVLGLVVSRQTGNGTTFTNNGDGTGTATVAPALQSLTTNVEVSVCSPTCSVLSNGKPGSSGSVNVNLSDLAPGVHTVRVAVTLQSGRVVVDEVRVTISDAGVITTSSGGTPTVLALTGSDAGSLTKVGGVLVGSGLLAVLGAATVRRRKEDAATES